MTFLGQIRPSPKRPSFLPLQRAAGTFSLEAINNDKTVNGEEKMKKTVKSGGELCK